MENYLVLLMGISKTLNTHIGPVLDVHECAFKLIHGQYFYVCI